MGPYAHGFWTPRRTPLVRAAARRAGVLGSVPAWLPLDRKSTRLNSSHVVSSYAVFCLKKKNIYHIFIG